MDKDYCKEALIVGVAALVAVAVVGGVTYHYHVTRKMRQKLSQLERLQKQERSRGSYRLPQTIV